MNRLQPPAPEASSFSRWGLGVVALVIGLFLLVYYVRLLQDSVARGAQWHQAQSAGAVADGARPAAQTRLVSVRR